MLDRFITEISGLARAVPTGVVLQYLGAVVAEAPSILSSRTLAAADGRVKGRVAFKTWRGDVVLDCGSLDRTLAFDPSHAFGLARELFGRNVYLRHFKPFDAAGETAVDLGGNRGFASALMAAAFRPSRLVYVEPDRRYLETMRSLLSNFPATSVEVHHGFVGAAPPGAGPLVDLDAILPEGPIAFVKMDIEGAEEPLLESGAPWLDRVRRLAMESHPDVCDVGKVVAALERRGFTVRPTDPVGRLCPAGVAGFVYAAREGADFA